MAQSGIYVGNQRGKRRRGVTIAEEALSTHVHILGRSGMGKSWLIRQMLAVDIENNDQGRGPGLCLIDPAGDLYDFAFDYASARKQARKRLHLIDLSQPAYFPGINYLDQPGNMDIGSQASMIVHGINKAFGQADEAARVRMERLFRAILIPFRLEAFTFDEVPRFINDPAFRNAVLCKLWQEKKLSEPLLAEWYGLSRNKPDRFQELMDPVMSRVNRFISLTPDSRLSNIFCQEHTTIDFRQAMEERHIVLCKLPRSAGYDDKLVDLLGTILVDKIMQAGYSRKPNEGHPFRVYIDEFARFVSNRDIQDGLNEMRKLRVSFVLAHQFLAQLKAKDELLYHAVKTNCNVRILFSVDDEDAEVAAKAMFTEFLSRDQVQDEIRTQLVTPRETTRVVTSEAEADSYMEALSEASGGSRMTSSGSTQQSSSGMSLAYSGDGNGNFLLVPDPTSTVSSEQSGTAYSSQSGEGESWMSSTTTARGNSRTVGRTTVPFYEMIIGDQITSRQFYGFQDKLAKLIHRIVSQDRRCAFIQVGRSVPIPFISAEIEEPSWTYAGRRIAQNCAYEKNKSGLPLPAIEAQRLARKERIAGILEEYGQQELPQFADKGPVEAEFEVVEDGPKALPKRKRVKMASAKTKKSKHD